MTTAPSPVRLDRIARAWLRIGLLGFGGPPAHIAMLRRRCVVDEGWIPAEEFEDGIAAVNLLPGPASTQLAIYCAWRLRGPVGALVGGLCFIVPGLVVVVALSAVLLGHPPQGVLGAAGGAGAAVPAVAVAAALALVPSSWGRAGTTTARRARWVLYGLAGVVCVILAGPWVVVVLLASGVVETVVRTRPGGRPSPPASRPAWLAPLATARRAVPVIPALGGLAALAWVALKVGALSYGGGFVIVPLMQSDAVHRYHWMTNQQFLNGVALGQLTPGPVTHTVAVVGYAAAGLGGALLAAAVAFAPSFVFVLAGGRYFNRLRTSPVAGAFLIGAGAAAIGAIAGSAVPLGLALSHLWQVAVLVGAAIWMVGLRRAALPALVAGALVGLGVVLTGLPA